MYDSRAGLGDISSEIADGLAKLRAIAQNVQNQATNAGDLAVKISNAATGAAAGAKAGYNAPATNTGLASMSLTTVAVVAGVAYLLTKGRRRA